MDKEEVHAIAKEAGRAGGREAARETLKAMGVDVEHTHEEQADRVFLRNQRIVSGRITLGVRLFIITAVVSGGLALIWEGIKHAIRLKGS